MVPRDPTDETDFRTSTISNKISRLSIVIASKLPISGVNDKRQIRELITLSTLMLKSPPRWRLLRL
jgi:hypothetical protein